MSGYLERFYQIILFYDPRRRSLSSQDVLRNPIAMETGQFRRISLVELPIFMFTRFTSAKSAKKLEAAFPLDSFAAVTRTYM